MTWINHPPEQRFFDKVQKTETCWNWIGGKKNAGYGQFSVNSQKVIAHRWAYRQFVGPIPDGYEIDHVCRNRGCVNPDHLEAVTPQVNYERRNAHRTQCRNGHPYNPENTRMQKYPDGYTCRVCKICAKASSRRLYERSDKFGKPHPNTKLTAELVRTIRLRLAAGESQRRIAREIGVIQQTISKMALGKTWTHIES